MANCISCKQPVTSGYVICEDCAKRSGMKAYLFGVTVCDPKTGIAIGHRIGAVFAHSEDAALEKVWEQFGNEHTCKPWVEEVPEDNLVISISTAA